MYTDRFTANSQKNSFARVLVEVDASQPLTKVIQMETPSGPWEQRIEYEWKPKYCNECLRFGHNIEECWYHREEPEVAAGEMEKPHPVKPGERREDIRKPKGIRRKK